MPTMEMYCPSSKTKVQATIVRGEYVTSKGGSKRRVLYGEYNGKKCLPKTVKADVFAKYGFSAEESLVGTPSPSSPMDDAPALVPAPAEPSNESFSAEGGDEREDFKYMRHRDTRMINGYRVSKVMPETPGEFTPYYYVALNLSGIGAEITKKGSTWTYYTNAVDGSEHHGFKNPMAALEDIKEKEISGEFGTGMKLAETFNSEGGDDDCDVCGIIKPLNAEGYCSECSHKSEYFNALSEDSYIITKSAEMDELADGVSAIRNRFGDSVGIVQVDDSDDDIEDVDVQIIDDGMDIVYEDTLGAESFNADERIELQGDDGPSYTWENLYYNCPDCDEELSVVGGRGGTLAVCENGCETEYPRNMLENFDEWHWFHNHGAHENARNDYKEPKESGEDTLGAEFEGHQYAWNEVCQECGDVPCKCASCGNCDRRVLISQLNDNDLCPICSKQGFNAESEVDDDGRNAPNECPHCGEDTNWAILEASGSWDCRYCGTLTYDAESQGLSKSARTVIGLTSLGIGMALWKSEWINKLFDRK